MGWQRVFEASLPPHYFLTPLRPSSLFSFFGLLSIVYGLFAGQTFLFLYEVSKTGHRRII